MTLKSKFFLCTTLVLISFSVTSQVTTIARGKKITVEGIAVNLKAGAAIQTMGHYYFVENRHSWDKTMENQRVIVTGKLIIYSVYVTEDDPTIQYAPIMEVIHKPRIRKSSK